MNPDIFATIAESLRAYRRADLRDLEPSLPNPVESLYVDPLPGDAVLKTALSGNTTYLVGRKGTGKSTVFARAQAEIRKRQDLVSIYIDVKALYDLLAANQAPVTLTASDQVSESLLREHFVRKHFLAAVVSEIISEVKKAASALDFWQRWTGHKRKYEEVIASLQAVSERIAVVALSEEEIPVLRLIDGRTRARERVKREHRDKRGLKAKGSATGASLDARINVDELEVRSIRLHWTSRFCTRQLIYRLRSRARSNTPAAFWSDDLKRSVWHSTNTLTLQCHVPITFG